MLEKELLWDRYKHVVDVHRTYMDFVVKVNVFYYAITGAIISFYFLHRDQEPLIKWSLALPVLMSVFLAVFFARSAWASRTSDQELKELAKALDFRTYSIIAKVLESMLWIFFVLFAVVSIGLLILFLS